MSKLVYVNDRFLDQEKATISIHDLNVQRGYGIFDFFRLVGNRPLHLEEHLDRFFFSAQQLRLPVPKSREDLKLVIKELIWENEMPDSGLRIQLTGGEMHNGFTQLHPVLFISQIEFAAPSQHFLENGIKMVTYEHQRQLPQVKSIDYLMSIWLQPILAERIADELLYFSNGLIRESPRSNIFLVTQDGKLVTPGEQILKGISRKKVLEIANSHFTTEERDIHLDEIASAKEIFLTSTTKQILPVSKVDGMTIGDGRPGPATKKLSEQLTQFCGM
jgi:branched-chain amino acid aminotransferase